MKLQAIWTGILYVFDLISLSPQRSEPLPETPLPAATPPPTIDVPRREGDYNCSYPEMTGFRNCHSSGNRGCWLYNAKTKEQYNIETDYDDPTKVPKGTLKEVNIY
jgi:hypothetical protein